MKIIGRIKRFWYHLLNRDAVRNCPVFLNEGCAHVDGFLCDFPDCETFRKYVGKDWVSCIECSFNESCSSRNYGLGCHDGDKNEK